MASLRAVDLDAVRLPPHSEEAERGVLGSCLLSRDAITLLATHLEPRDYYFAHHSAIWRAMTTLFHRRVPLDLITLVQQLRTDGALDRIDGAETYIAGLIDATPTAVHAEHYAGIVREASIRRQLATCGEALVGAAYNDSIPLTDVITDADTAIHEAAKVKSREGYVTMREAIESAYERIGADKKPLLYRTGIGPLDRTIGGVKPGQLVVIAARPAVGKSALATQIAFNMARVKMPVGIVSLEMSEAELTDRLIGFKSGVNMHSATLGVVSDADYASMATAMGSLAELPLLIDDRSDASLHDVLARIRTMHADHGIQAVTVDYIQLMHVTARTGRRSDNRANELGIISGQLKVIARELKIVVFCLAQLRRDVEQRSNPRPMLSDLKDSGSIEQDTDIVAFIHRPDHYDKKAELNVAEIIVAKHRNGPVGARKAQFVPRVAKFDPPEEGYYGVA